MNFEEQGIPIAIVKNSKAKKTPLVSVDDKDNARNSYDEIVLQNDEQFQCIPNPNTERQILYITGRSGSGKSYYTLHYCLEYKRMFPKRNIYLFSALAEDTTIDKLSGLKRIKLTDDFVKDEITADDFKNSMVIFDDTDVIGDKKIRNKVNYIIYYVCVWEYI